MRILREALVTVLMTIVPLGHASAAGNVCESVVASHRTNGTIDRTRTLCPYPQVARYTGNGSIDEAENFTCRLP